MELIDFKNQWLNKSVDYDQALGPQCVDLIRQYCDQMLGFLGHVGNAINLTQNPFPEYLELHKNTLIYIPPKGAIAVWNNKVGYGAGHCAIVLEAGLMRFTSLDQNWLQIKTVKEVIHTYTNVDCFLVPRTKATNAQYNQLVDDLAALVKKYPRL